MQLMICVRNNASEVKLKIIDFCKLSLESGLIQNCLAAGVTNNGLIQNCLAAGVTNKKGICQNDI
jgi:hypothetical protein